MEEGDSKLKKYELWARGVTSMVCSEHRDLLGGTVGLESSAQNGMPSIVSDL